MNDFTYQQTLPLKLLPSYGRHDFVVGESNIEAVNMKSIFAVNSFTDVVYTDNWLPLFCIKYSFPNLSKPGIEKSTSSKKTISEWF